MAFDVIFAAIEDELMPVIPAHRSLVTSKPVIHKITGLVQVRVNCALK